MDIQIFVGDAQMPPDLVATYLPSGFVGGVGIYNAFIHIDTRNKIARW